MFDLHHLPMNFIPKKTNLVFPEGNSCSLILAEKTKQAKYDPN